MTPAEAITNVTVLAAEVCGVGDRVGRWRPARTPTCWWWLGDPLADVAAIHDVLAVYAQGRRLSRRVCRDGVARPGAR